MQQWGHFSHRRGGGRGVLVILGRAVINLLVVITTTRL
jgi:hypothetical protein